MEPISIFLGILLGALTTAAVVAYLNWDEISTWIRANRSPNKNIGVTIKEMLANGDYGICTGIFSPMGEVGAINAWKTPQLDQSVTSRFGHKNAIMEHY